MEPRAPAILSHVLRVERIVFASPLVCAGLFRCAPDDPLFPGGRPCSSYCIVFPREVAWIQHEGTPRFVADASIATFYNRGQIYRRWSIGGRPDRCDWLAFPEHLVRQAVDVYSPRDAQRSPDPFCLHAAPVSAPLYAAQRRLFDAMAAGTGVDEGEIEERALLMLDSVLRAGYCARSSRPRAFGCSRRVNDGIEAVQQHLAGNPAARSSLASLARLAGLSPFHLSREFHRQTGHTITSYRTGLRLRAALEPIADGEDLTTVALRLGFASHSHFTHAFRRRLGFTPSALGRSGRLRSSSERLRSSRHSRLATPRASLS